MSREVRENVVERWNGGIYEEGMVEVVKIPSFKRIGKACLHMDERIG